MKKVAVLIPVYLPHISVEEEKSIIQSMRVLCGRDVVLVCPVGLDVSYYLELSNKLNIEIRVERFLASFFDGIKGYNRLMLSKCFYERFSNYEYVLICQTDAFVFRDELDVWCKKGYDYIGAPLFDDCFDLRKARVGNGGFCLRRIGAYLDFFQGRRHVFKAKDIADRISFHNKPYTRWLVWLLMALGWRNKPKSVARRWQYNEDAFWSLYLDGSNYALRKPLVTEALTFAFERYPSECYKQINHLPFGCHAWRKYQYEDFWKDIIRIDK